jgi:hypothetical protein
MFGSNTYVEDSASEHQLLGAACCDDEANMVLVPDILEDGLGLGCVPGLPYPSSSIP